MVKSVKIISYCRTRSQNGVSWILAHKTDILAHKMAILAHDIAVLSSYPTEGQLAVSIQAQEAKLLITFLI